MIALAASTGLRVGELLALKVGDDGENSCWAADVIHVRKSIWKRQMQAPKTVSAVRLIEISTPVQKMLQFFADGVAPGSFLFAAKRTGQALGVSYTNESIMALAGVPGAHALRRYRTTWLDQQGAPRSLTVAWLGHSAGGNITDRYIKSDEDQIYRRNWCERIGTGLDLEWATKPQIAAPSVVDLKSAKSRKPYLASPRAVRAAQAAIAKRQATLLGGKLPEATAS